MKYCRYTLKKITEWIYKIQIIILESQYYIY